MDWSHFASSLTAALIMAIIVVPGVGIVGWLIRRTIADMMARCERMERKVDALCEKFAALPAEFAAAHKRISETNERVAKLEAKVEDGNRGMPRR